MEPQARPADPCVLVIFGSSGDLTKRLLIPALYNLRRAGLLPEGIDGGISTMPLSYKPWTTGPANWQAIVQNLVRLTEFMVRLRRRTGQLIHLDIEPEPDGLIENTSEVIAFFNDHRKKNLAKYRSLAESDLQKSSLHPRLKVQLTPVDLAWFDAEHDDHHLVTINELLKALSPVTVN